MRERERENFWPDTQSSHELILAAKASNGGGHCSCSTDTTPDRGSGWPRLRGSGGVPVRARGHSVGALRGRQSPELIRPWDPAASRQFALPLAAFSNRWITAWMIYRHEAQIGILGTSSSTNRDLGPLDRAIALKLQHENDSLRHDQPLEVSPGRV